MPEVAAYMDLPWTYRLTGGDCDGGWFIQILELPGCMSQGSTIKQALEIIREALQGWIEISLEDGDPIPMPVGI
jgi:antitoxin HicB